MALHSSSNRMARCRHSSSSSRVPLRVSASSRPLPHHSEQTLQRQAPSGVRVAHQQHSDSSIRVSRRVSASSALVSGPASSQQHELQRPWRRDLASSYVTGRLLGAGSFGSVYLGIDMRTGKEVAIKVLPKQRNKLTREKTLEKIAREVAILQRLQGCPGVVQLEGVFEDQDTVSIVTEVCQGGDLQQFAEANTINERALAHIAVEVIKIVKACHDAGLLHGDIKPANFCLKQMAHNPLTSALHDASDPDSSSWLRAIDFGCSQMLPAYSRLTKRTGTPVYMAPELYQRDYHQPADMWSVGIMLYQLFARRFPFWDTMQGCKSSQLDDVARAVAYGDINYNYGAWLGMSAEGKAFVSGCLQRDPAQRLTAEEALQHPWVQRMLGAAAQPHVSVKQAVQKGLRAHTPQAPAGPTPYPVPQQPQQPQQQPQSWPLPGARKQQPQYPLNLGALVNAVTAAVQAS